MRPAASERAERAALAIVFLAVAGLVLLYDPVIEGLERHHLVKEAVLALVALALLGVGVVTSRRLDLLDGALVLFALSTAAASIGAIDRDVATRGLMVAAGIAALGVGVRDLSRERRAILDRALLGLGVALALLMIAEAYDLVPRISLPTYAPGVTVGQRNNAAHLLAIGIAFLSATMLCDREARPTTSIARALALALFVAAMVLTRSRGAWLAALAGLAVALVLGFTTERSGMRLALVIAALFAGAALPLTVRSHLGWHSAHPYADSAARLVDGSEGSGRGRLIQWETSLELVERAPLFGVGPGHWAIHYPSVAREDDPTVHVDAWAPTSRLATSDPIAISVERGALGLLALFMLLAAWVIGLGRPLDARGAARWSGLAALAVVSSVDCLLQIAIGACVIVLLVPDRASDGARTAPRWLALVLVPLVLVAVPGAITRLSSARLRPTADVPTLRALAEADPFDVATRYRLIDRALYEGDCEAALIHLRALGAIRPHLPRALHDRAVCEGRVPR